MTNRRPLTGCKQKPGPGKYLAFAVSLSTLSRAANVRRSYIYLKITCPPNCQSLAKQVAVTSQCTYRISVDLQSLLREVGFAHRAGELTILCNRFMTDQWLWLPMKTVPALASYSNPRIYSRRRLGSSRAQQLCAVLRHQNA